MPPLPVSDSVESAMARTQLALKSLSPLNVPMSSDLLGRLTRHSESLKCGAPADDEYLDVPEFKKIRLGVSELESMKGLEVHIGGDPNGDNCEKLISKRLHGGSMAWRGSKNVMDAMVG